MSPDTRPQVVIEPKITEALDSLARLYRDIGIAAVAAALELPAPKPKQQRVAAKDIPAILRDVGMAA
jgi:hypothetical protein